MTCKVDVLGSIWKKIDTCDEILKNSSGNDPIGLDGVCWFCASGNRVWSSCVLGAPTGHGDVV